MQEQYLVDQQEAARVETQVRSFVHRVYMWMTFALTLTALVAVVAVSTPAITRVVFQPSVMIGLIIGELALVFVLSLAIGRLSSATATALFVLYSAINGLTLSIIFLIYTSESIGSTFFVTAATFGAMSLYGYTTQRDLTSWGNLLFMALIGLILASVVNMFMASSSLYWLITYGGVIIFVGLTAYDTQKIKMIGMQVAVESEAGRKLAIIGALALYLDFINLFLYLLRLLGKRR